MVNWAKIQYDVAKFIVGQKWLNEYLERRVEDAVKFVMDSAVKKQIIRKKTAQKVVLYVVEEDVVKSLLEWYAKDE